MNEQGQLWQFQKNGRPKKLCSNEYSLSLYRFPLMIAYHGEPTARSSVLKMLRACLSQFFLPCLCSDRLSGSLVLSLLKSFFPLRAVSELALSLSPSLSSSKKANEVYGWLTTLVTTLHLIRKRAQTTQSLVVVRTKTTTWGREKKKKKK